MTYDDAATSSIVCDVMSEHHTNRACDRHASLLARRGNTNYHHSHRHHDALCHILCRMLCMMVCGMTLAHRTQSATSDAVAAGMNWDEDDADCIDGEPNTNELFDGYCKTYWREPYPPLTLFITCSILHYADSTPYTLHTMIDRVIVCSLHLNTVSLASLTKRAGSNTAHRRLLLMYTQV